MLLVLISFVLEQMWLPTSHSVGCGVSELRVKKIPDGWGHSVVFAWHVHTFLPLATRSRWNS